MHNNLLRTDHRTYAVPNNIGRLFTVPAGQYMVVQAAVLSSRESTLPTAVRLWKLSETAPVGDVSTITPTVTSLPITMHLAYGTVGPCADVELLSSSVILQPGESIGIDQLTTSYALVVSILSASYTSGMPAE